ncbi:MAG: hypothetical protein KatS3mg059_1803 [Thermomicrobiales bacterium]|nr:MAG: hypothetical protein KatS3mg059_1803 [Thermomicrobiales bacterium]
MRYSFGHVGRASAALLLFIALEAQGQAPPGTRCNNPGTCGNFRQCSPPGSCTNDPTESPGVCFTTPDGTGVCGEGVPCAGLPTCQTNADCAPGAVCQIGTCCSQGGGNICVPISTLCNTSQQKPMPVATPWSLGLVGTVLVIAGILRLVAHRRGLAPLA